MSGSIIIAFHPPIHPVPSMEGSHFYEGKKKPRERDVGEKANHYSGYI
jgi:hypothetical protein